MRLWLVFDTTYASGYIGLRFFVVNPGKWKHMYFSAGKTLTTALAAIIVSGCASIANQDAMDTERRLSAAGFQMKLADTPEKLAHLQFFADRRLVPTTLDGKTVFVYADAQSCKCVYVGSQANYQEYERLAIQQNVVDEQRATAEDAAMAAETNAQMNWGLWGVWPRPIIY